MLSGVDIEQSAFRQRGFVLAAGFLGLIALAGVIVALAHVFAAGRRVAPSAAERGPAASSATAGVSEAATGRQAATCPPLPSGDESVPARTPAGARWVLVGDMAEPSAPATIGPERRRDRFGECYAHSPLGALYAAENVIAAFSAQPQSTVITALAVPGHARDAAAQQALAGDNRDLEQIAGGASTLIGFAFEGYSSQEAEVSVAIQGPSGAQGAVPLVMRWVGDDWRFVVPPGGQDFAVTQLTSMAGFVPWSAS
jgi:hypothetical protein